MIPSTEGKKGKEIATAAKKRYSVSTPSEYSKDGESMTYWTSIGSAFTTETGLMVHLNALPLNGKMFIQEAKKKDEQ